MRIPAAARHGMANSSDVYVRVIDDVAVLRCTVTDDVTTATGRQTFQAADESDLDPHDSKVGDVWLAMPDPVSTEDRHPGTWWELTVVSHAALNHGLRTAAGRRWASHLQRWCRRPWLASDPWQPCCPSCS